MRHSRKNGARKEYAIAPEHILEVRGLNVHIKVDDYVLHAVRGVSFDMKKGETLGLVGESGCGKSVTSKEILGINPDNCSAQGEILYRTKSGQVLNLLELDRDGAGYRAIRGAEIAMIFQEPMTAFSPLYTIGNQLGEIVRIHQPETSKNGARERVLEMLKKVGIANPEKRIDQYPHEFSGGMLQRALIAMMLCCNPDLLIADEPTTALDVTIQAQILRIIRRLTQEMDTAVILITHDMGVIAETADYVMVMYAGKSVEYGTAEDIFDRPMHPYTVGLLSSIPKLGSGQEERLYTIEGTVPGLDEMPEGCRFCTRCPYVEERCRQADPGMRRSGGHLARCWRCGKEEQA